MNRSFSTFILLLAILTFSSCKTKENAKRKDLRVNKTEYLFQQLSQQEFMFDHLSAKANVKLTQNNKKKPPFKANIRIKRDSLIWISISAFHVEVARLMISQDSVKVINKVDKNYFLGDYEYINRRFNVELEFDVIQSILVGNPINFEPDEKVKFAIDKEKYYLGNLKKRKARKADDKPQRIERQKEEVISLWIDQKTFKIRNFLFSDLTANRFITGKYDQFTPINDQLLPHDLAFEFKSEKPANVELVYSKVSLEGPLKFSFNISSKYEQIFY